MSLRSIRSMITIRDALDYLWEQEKPWEPTADEDSTEIDFDSDADYYLAIYELKKTKYSSPLDVAENVMEWLDEDEYFYDSFDISYMNPYQLMKDVIDEYGSEVFQDCNPSRIQRICEYHHIRGALRDELEGYKGLEWEVKTLLKNKIQPLIKGYKRYSVSKMLDKTLLHHLSPVVLDFLS